MPIYEFACEDCRKRVSIFQRSMNQATVAHCPECGGGNLRRLVSSFAFHRGIDFDEDPAWDEGVFDDDVDEDDPQSVARWARSMSGRMGADLPPDVEADLARMEAGDMPAGDGADDDWDD
jgi:putative FmdB family regulatory protein